MKSDGELKSATLSDETSSETGTAHTKERQRQPPTPTDNHNQATRANKMYSERQKGRGDCETKQEEKSQMKALIYNQN